MCEENKTSCEKKSCGLKGDVRTFCIALLTTVIVLALGVLLLTPLAPVLSNPAFAPAFDNVVPALFGALGLKYCLKGKKFAAIPLVLSSAGCILMPSMISQTSVLLIVIGALTIGVSFVFYKKGALDE